MPSCCSWRPSVGCRPPPRLLELHPRRSAAAPATSRRISPGATNAFAPASSARSATAPICATALCVRRPVICGGADERSSVAAAVQDPGRERHALAAGPRRDERRRPGARIVTRLVVSSPRQGAVLPAARLAAVVAELLRRALLVPQIVASVMTALTARSSSPDRSTQIASASLVSAPPMPPRTHGLLFAAVLDRTPDVQAEHSDHDKYGRDNHDDDRGKIGGNQLHRRSLLAGSLKWRSCGLCQCSRVTPG